MAEEALFTGIDVGSTAVRIAVGQRLPVGDKEQMHIVGAAEIASEGINRGVINSIEDAVSSVSGCIERVERMTGLPVEQAYVSISGANVSMLESKGASDIMVLVGGVIPGKDIPILKEMGVAEVFPGGSDIDAPADFVKKHLS